MTDTLARSWWVVILRGVAGILFGLAAWIWPGITVVALVFLFGAYALIDGVFALGAVAFGRTGGASRSWLAVEGVAGVVIGIVAFVWPEVTTLVLLWLIAAWALATGMFEVLAAIRLRREIRGEWLLGLGGILSLFFGFLLAVWPATGALALILLIGAYAVVFGVVLIGLGLRLRRLRFARGGVRSPHPATT